jgi:hypothetical protein
MQGVHTLDESTRKKGQQGAAGESEVLSGGSDGRVQTTGNPTLGDSVPVLPAEPSASPGVSIGNLDILASLKEAELFALEVKKFADLIPDPRWQAISRGMDYAIQFHDKMNQARSNS